MFALGSHLADLIQVRSVLESAEDIDAAVCVRSSSSVYRATRHIHASRSEFTTFASRVQFAFEIPTVAAPTFETSYGI
jgi:RAB6A-GEF complex partner protein 2